jgi:hypothetical protein
MKKTFYNVESAMKGTLISNLFLSMLLGIAMKRIWTLINTLQILVMLPKLSVSYPENLLLLLQNLYDISNVKVIPDNFSQKVLSFIGISSSQSASENMSDLILAVIGFPILITILSGMYLIFRK